MIPSSSRVRRPASRAAIVAALNVAFTLMLGNRPVVGRDVLRPGRSTSSVTGSSDITMSANSVSAQTAATAKRAQDTLLRAAQAMQSMQSMQSAARAAAAGGPNNLGADPSHPGQQLPNIPDGLASGGLVPDSGLVANGLANTVATWSGANTPVQSTDNGNTSVSIKQTSQQALLNWQTFNIGKNTTLTFDQSAGGTDVGTWVAFNKINDPTGAPSQILGSIKAAGQVYLINQNGIIFGGSSQVNTHALVASSLPINDNLISLGLLNNPDLQFLFSSLPIDKLSAGTMDAFTPTLTAPGGVCGDVTVQQGATLTSPTSSDHVGGKIALIGSNVTNAGTISTPDGQTILAAGQQVALTSHASSDASLRGLDVAIGGGGTATNAVNAAIEAPRGNITIAGKSVNQLGVAQSTTSVSLNGRIDLLANYNTVRVNPAPNTVYLYSTSTGVVTLGASSVTEVAPELTSAESAAISNLALSSQINLQGKSIYLGSNAVLTAPSGAITLNAGTWQPQSTTYIFLCDIGQVYLDDGAIIDVAGSENVIASVSDNIVSAKLQGSELANSPLQRYGVLRGKTVKVDARQSGLLNGKSWVGTSLADVSGNVNLIQHTVGQLTVSGGSVTINAGDSFVMQPGSRIDVSGGWINYKGGEVQTTRLISGSHIFNIAQASADLVYDGIYEGFTETHSSWNISQTFTSSLLSGAHYETGYIEGGAAGSLAITVPSMALDGNLYGNTVTGARQHTNAPASGALVLAFQNQYRVGATVYAGSPTPPSVIFQSDSNLLAADAFSLESFGSAATLRSDRKEKVILSPDLLNENGFGTFTLANGDGDVVLPVNERIVTLPGGAVTITGANITIEGKISVPAGSLSLSAYDYSPYKLAKILTQYKSTNDASLIPTSDSTRGHFTLGSGATLSAAGLIIDDQTTSSTAELVPTAVNALVQTICTKGQEFTTTLVKEGGKVVTQIVTTAAGMTQITNYLAESIVTSMSDAGKITTTISCLKGTKLFGPFPSLSTSTKDGGSIAIAGYNVDLLEGGSFDVSGGLVIAGNGKKTYGKGGGISVSAGQDPNVNTLLNGTLVLKSAMTGYGGFGAAGGALSLKMLMIQVGGVAANEDTLLLSREFFTQGGFSSFALTGLGEKTATGDYLPAVSVAPGTVLEPTAQSRLAVPGEGGLEWETVRLPEGVRSPVNLTFTATGVDDFSGAIHTLRGVVLLGEGSEIRLDALASIKLDGNMVGVLGSIEAPGGSIKLTGATDINKYVSSTILTTVDLGPKSVLSTEGCTLLTPDSRGYRTGSVLAGGAISLKGNIVAESGATLDVSGASGALDKLATYGDGSIETNGSLKGQQFTRTLVESNGGSITFTGGQELVINAALRGDSGGSSAQGGSLTITCPGFTGDTLQNINLAVSQQAPILSTYFYPGGGSGIGYTATDIYGNALTDVGYFGADSFNGRGFDSLTLGGVVRFSGAVTLNAASSLAIADSGVIYGDSQIKLIAPYIALGTAFQSPTLKDAVVSSPIPYLAPASYGTGSLNVTASIIDIGTLSLQQIGSANFVAANGDIRGNGFLDVAGDITMTAGQIYPTSGVAFTIAAYDHDGTAGSVTFEASGSRRLPLSAGGVLNVYGSTITQGGVLRAPLGTINLGWDGTGTAQVDLLTKKNYGTTKSLKLTAGGIVSVSAIDPATGTGITIPYGLNLNGSSWIDPTGAAISASGLPTKGVNLSGLSIDTQEGSTIDIRGGGDLLSYRFVKGTGGSEDILASLTSFAVIPDYQADYAPYATYNTNRSSGSTVASNLGTDLGYTSNLKVGDRVYLSASPGLAAGYYTLLPARYALLTGAYLITPKSGTPAGTVAKTDGAYLVSGYRYNDLNSSQSGHGSLSQFEVASSSVLAQRAEYVTYSANTFFDASASVRLPKDSGKLLLQATQAMSLAGSVLSKAPLGGRGSQVDVSSPSDILIGDLGTSAAAGTLFLSTSTLNSIGADSLLIGGSRSNDIDGTSVTVTTQNMTVDNAGSPLKGKDIILVANNALTLAPGADIEQTDSLSSEAHSLTLGGNGALVRVSADASAQISRSSISASSASSLTIGAGALLSGAGLTLDSTYATFLDPGAQLIGNAVSLNSGQISLEFEGQGLADLKKTAGKTTVGLVLSGQALRTVMASSKSLSLLSYSSIDLYGAGQVGDATFESLELHAAEIRGFNPGNVTFAAKNIVLDNHTNAVAPQAVDNQSIALGGILTFAGETIKTGNNQLNIDLYADVALNASGALVAKGQGGLATQGALSITTPLITGISSANLTVNAGGALNIQAGSGSGDTSLAGLGATLTLQGSTITANNRIWLPSGVLKIHATGGDVQIGGQLDVAGTEQDFFDCTKYTSGGRITLTSDQGGVQLASTSTVDVAAPAKAGNAGSLTISTPKGFFTSGGSLLGQGGAGGAGGSFSLDVASIALDSNGHASLAPLDLILNHGGFSQARSIRVRGGDAWVEGRVSAHQYNLSADGGSITIAGIIDASGDTGGSINLSAHGSVLLEGGSLLTVVAKDFDSAGKGGSISLEAATLAVDASGNTSYDTTAEVNVKSGSRMDLSVASYSAASASLGKYTGTLLLRSHQKPGSTTIPGSLDVQIAPIAGEILNASKIIVEGYKEYKVTDGSIDHIKQAVSANGEAFVGTLSTIDTNGNEVLGSESAGYATMLGRLAGGNATLASQLIIQVGAEIISNGDLTLSSDWNLAALRFGPKKTPGSLTLRAKGDLVFLGSLSDGFVSSAYQSLLLAENKLLPTNAQTWSYRLVAGADLTAADSHQVQSSAALEAAGLDGSLLLGKFCDGADVSAYYEDDLTSKQFALARKASFASAIAGNYQVIRNGSGDIDIAAGGDVQLRNQFATIYTAGTLIGDPTEGGRFDVPVLYDALGKIYPAQYSRAGGNVTLNAQGNIEHVTMGQDDQGMPVVVSDSSRELPSNWLYRRSNVDGDSFALFSYYDRSSGATLTDVASTTWWVDFSNFFEGVGTLGGGNVSVSVGGDINNIDVVAATNARMLSDVPDASKMVELGGGDITVHAGHDINGGVYYVERGKGKLSADAAIVLHSDNYSRSPNLANIGGLSSTYSYPNSVDEWLPTTLFLGKGSFEVTANGDVTLGPVVNAFLLPQGIGNTARYKTYFSTNATTDTVEVSSLCGNVKLKTSAASPTEVTGNSVPSLYLWLDKQLRHTIAGLESSYDSATAAYYQPWLMTVETDMQPWMFSTDSGISLGNLMPASLDATAFTGNINIVGNLILSPSPTGSLNLLAAKSINGMQSTGLEAIYNAAGGNTVDTKIWYTATINLSDADPSNLSSITAPLSNSDTATPTDLFADALAKYFDESGATATTDPHLVLQTKQALHKSGLLHLNDTEPLRLYAGTGDLSGLTLYAGKESRILAGSDIFDIALYIQNVRSSDVSVVSARGNLTAYDVSPTAGNSHLGASAQAGDIQISGPGTIEVLAGVNLDLGSGTNRGDGTEMGLTSIGNTRNPSLPFTGADIVAAAGFDATGLEGATVDFNAFAAKFLNPTTGGTMAERYLPELRTLLTSLFPTLDLSDATNAQTWESFNSLPDNRRRLLALEIFYHVLRDAGRDHGKSTTDGYKNYNAGYEAIAALFPGKKWSGDISLTSLEIKTKNGGNISLFAPGGKVTVGYDVVGQASDQGILTEHGGNISIFSKNSVSVGTSRIFTLRGGNEIIWSTLGDIAAGSSSQTVKSAPPTRVLIDPQSGDIKTDLAGLATGGGIGALETVVGVPAADIDLIAPSGAVDAGDAGIRASGNLSVSALQVLNATNISVGGISTGTPVAASAPSMGNLQIAAQNTTPTSGSAAEERAAAQRRSEAQQQEAILSIITVEVLGYGGGEE